jgi:hypothetical protein
MLPAHAEDDGIANSGASEQNDGERWPPDQLVGDVMARIYAGDT